MSATFLGALGAGLVLAPAGVQGSVRPTQPNGSSTTSIYLQTSQADCAALGTSSKGTSGVLSSKGSSACYEELDSFTLSLVAGGAPAAVGSAIASAHLGTVDEATATLGPDDESVKLFGLVATGQVSPSWVVDLVNGGVPYLTITFSNVKVTSWTLTASAKLLPAVQFTFSFEKVAVSYITHGSDGATSASSSQTYQLGGQKAS